MQKPILFFDFDGVIVHSIEMWIKIAQMDRPEVSRDSFIKAARGNVHDGNKEKVVMGDQKAKTILDHQIERQETITEALLAQQLAEGMEEAIKALANSYRLFVVTSGNTYPVRQYLAAQKLEQFFLDILGADVHTSKYEKIKMIFKKTQGSADQSIIITDTLGDLREAARAHVPGIAVSWGLHDKADLRKGDPIAILDSVEELVPVIKRHFGG